MRQPRCVFRLLPTVVLVLAGCAQAQGPATAPAGDAASSGDSKLDALLDRMERRGGQVRGLRCRLTYKYVTTEIVESEQVKLGELEFLRTEPNAKFHLRFDKLVADGVEKPTGEAFTFDGLWLTERNDRARTVVRRQIVRPGERVDPFQLGKGPFPLPFGQRRSQILQNFRVSLSPADKNDPPDTDHLHCVPLPESDLAERYRRVELYVERRRSLPVRLVTERVSDGNRIEVDFQDIDTRDALPASRFEADIPRDYELTEEPLPPAVDKPEGAVEAGRR